MTGIAIAILIAGAAGGALAAGAVLAVLYALSHARGFRTLVHDADAKRERSLRERRRHRILDRAGVPPWTLAQLTTVANDVACKSPRDAELFDLEGLLDHYVALECLHQQVEHSLASMDVAPARRSLEALPDGQSPRRRVIERRLELWTRGRARAAALSDSIQATTELIYLIAQRVEMSDEEIDSARIEACLDQLAAEDELAHTLTTKR